MTSRVALVTGGTGGIGTAMVKRLARAGHRVATNYRNEEKAKEWQAALRADGVDCLIVPGDVADFASSQAMIKDIESQLGGVDILINNAGITRDTTFHRMSPVQWSDVIATNLTGCYNVTRSVIEGMRARMWGRIVQISSINGQKGQIGQTNYSAAKAGMIGFTKALALENARKGVTVNCIAPGYIDTEMVGAMDEKVLAGIISQIPVGRLGKGEEIADMVSWLAGERAGYVTGCTLSLNGGQYLVG